MSAPQPAGPLELLLPAAPQSLNARARAVGGAYALLLELATETKTLPAVSLGGDAAGSDKQGDQKRPTHEQV